MGGPAEASRVAVLVELLETPSDSHRLGIDLAKFDWDSNELVLINPGHVTRALQLFLEGKVDRSALVEWANLLEGRDDIGLEPIRQHAIRASIHALANPALDGELDDIKARAMIAELEH